MEEAGLEWNLSENPLSDVGSWTGLFSVFLNPLSDLLLHRALLFRAGTGDFLGMDLDRV